MVGRLLVGFKWPNLQFSVSWLVDISVGFVWLKLQSSVSWQVDFQWGSCGSIFSFLCHGWQTFSGVRVAQSLVFCVMVGRLLVGFVWLNLYFSVSWLVDFSWDSYGSIFSFLRHGRQTFSGVRVPQSLVFCVMVGRLLMGFVWLNLQFSVSWQVDFSWGSCGSIFSFPCHGWQTFRGVRVAQSSFLYHDWQTFSGLRVAQSLVFCVMVGRLLAGFEWLNLQFSVSRQVVFQWGSCGSIFSFLCHGRQTFSGVRVAQSLVFCVMVGRLSVGFVWLKLQSSVSWQVDFQWGSCGSIVSFLCHGRQIFSGVRVAQSSFLYHGWQTFSGVRVAQSLVFCVMVGRLLAGFEWLNLQFSVSRQVDFQLGSCGSIFCFLCHGRQTFSGVRVAQSLVFCVMVGRHFSGIRVAQTLVFCVMVGRLLVGFVWLNLQFSVSWLVDFQWGSCGSIFSFPCHGRQTFSGVRVAQSLLFCVMVGRLFVGLVWLNLQLSASWQVDFQWGSCASIFSFLCHGRQTFSGVRVAQSLVFCVMVGRLLVGFVWLNLQFSMSWLVDFQWGSCGSIFSFLCHGWQTFRGVRMAQSLFFCVMVGRLLVGFVWLNLQFSVSWLVDFQWGSCGSSFSFLCHGWQTFSLVRVAQSLVLCFMVGRLLVVFVWLNLQFSVSWQVDFQWASCVSIFSFLCHGWQTFSGLRVSQSLVFCVMVGRLLAGFEWLNLQFSVSRQVDFQWGSCGSIQFSVSWLVDFQWASCGSIFSFLCHGRQTFSGV